MDVKIVSPPAYNGVFKRCEIKYPVREATLGELEKRLREHMTDDRYGSYSVGNIYFDTADSLLIRRSLEKPVYKEKLRLRAYGVPERDGGVFLELKKKYRNVVYKRRERMTLAEAGEYVASGAEPKGAGQIHSEIDWARRFYGLEPKMLVAYDRLALRGIEDESLRLTLDRNIRYRTSELDLAAGFDGERIGERDVYIMEIKFERAFPMWLSRTLSELSIFKWSFSKYGEAYLAERQKSPAGELCGVAERSRAAGGRAARGAEELLQEASGHA